MLANLIQEFLADMKASGNSEATIEAYGYHLNRFRSWCEQNGLNFRSITTKEIKQFRNYLVKQGLSPNTINMHIYALSSFYNYLVEEGIVQGSPIIGRRLRVSTARTTPQFLADDELTRILDYLKENKPYHIQLAFRTMLATGIRVGEAASLAPEDIVFKNGIVLVHVRRGKRNRERWSPVTDESVARELLEYKKSRKNCTSLFGVTRDTLIAHAWDIKKKTGIDFRSHRLRHTLGTNLLAQGYSLDVVQEVLGHENIITTRRYAATLPKSFFQVAARVS